MSGSIYLRDLELPRDLPIRGVIGKREILEEWVGGHIFHAEAIKSLVDMDGERKIVFNGVIPIYDCRNGMIEIGRIWTARDYSHQFAGEGALNKLIFEDAETESERISRLNRIIEGYKLQRESVPIEFFKAD